MESRQYQDNAVNKTIDRLDRLGSAVCVMPTGCGKTITFCRIVKHYLPAGQVLIFAHRDELIKQAQAKAIAVAGSECGLFCGRRKCNLNSPVIAVSVLSIINHLEKFNPDNYSLIVIDEAHHSCGPSYKKVINHFKKNKNIKILGVTATPERGDRQALGQVYKTVSTDYNMRRAMSDGWLTPFVTRKCRLQGLNLKECKISGADLSAASLNKLLTLEKNISPIVRYSLHHARNRKKIIVFTAGVAQAAAISNRINKKSTEGCAAYVHAETPMPERRQIIADFEAGKIRWLCNCGILTEGYDCPEVDCIVMARPTYVRGMYIQMLGRGLRPNVPLSESMGSEGRKKAMRESNKPNCLVIDFTENSDNHKLVHATDIYNGLMQPPLTGVENSSGGAMLRESNRGLFGGHGFRKFTFTGYAKRGIKNKMRIHPAKMIAISRITAFFKSFLGIE